MALPREAWLDLARKLEWELSYVREEEAFPEAVSGRPWLSNREWAGWDEPYRTGFAEYAKVQHEKETSVAAVRESLGRGRDMTDLDRGWLNAVKLHTATLPLAEFAAVIGNLRAARFGRDSAWRSTSLLGALDECRHTQIPLALMHDMLRADAGFDWTHRLYHTNDWVAIAARHLSDEMLVTADPIEFAVATNFVFESGFTNLQFVGLSAIAERVGDHLFRKMVTSIQTDEARHSQVGGAVLPTIIARDPEYAQYLVDKWFWRSWLLFAIVTGFAVDYLTPLKKRTLSFKEFMHEWILDQFTRRLDEFGLKKPWYWDQFIASLDYYHHLVYASAYTYRATVWFDFVLPGPDERAWLREKYPASWAEIDPVWERVTQRWKRADPGVDLAVHGTAIVGFCHLCQIVLCQGTPERNAAVTAVHGDRKLVFCSAPCRWIFEREPARYLQHKDLVRRVLEGDAPGNLLALLTQYSSLTYESWGKDAYRGVYPWLERAAKPGPGTGP